MVAKKKAKKKKISWQEALLALGIGVLVGVVVFLIVGKISPTIKTSKPTTERLKDTERARLVLESDIAQAGFDPRSIDLEREKILPIALAAPTKIRLQGDYNMSGAIGDQQKNQVTESLLYSYDPEKQQLLRGRTPILKNVVEFSLVYFDVQGKLDASVPGPVIEHLRDIRSVQVAWKYSHPKFGTEREKFQVKIRNAR